MRDAHLRAALRHAPDRDLRPSESVSARILASAHRAAGTAGQGAGTSSLARWRERLVSAANALRQPAPAAAFASLMLATVIGVMWRDGPPPEVARERAPAGATASVEASGVSAPARADGDRAPASDRVAEAAAPVASAARRPAREAPADRAMKAASQPAPKPAPSTAAPQAAAEPPPSEPPARAAPAAAAARGEALTAAAAPAAVDPLGPLATAWAASPGDRADAVAELRRRTQGRWALVPAEDALPLMSQGAPVPGPNGTSLGRLLLIDNAVLWQSIATGSATWRAPLSAAAAASLRERLAPEAPPQR